ncbi:MAG: hypothetical protein BWZ10_02626 [candidate division BRC1 bacterium ADurb.BinA364]|nr:MAG: hypothetical protein BWZ10_02626 [candidate division BRC1 bacterium ADurb.BinA364]
MELEGRLSAFSLPEVLQFLALGKMTGVLTIAQNEAEVHLSIREGKIISSSTMDRPQRLGDMLLHRGILSRAALEEALAAQSEAADGRLIGEMLVAMRLCTQEQLTSAIRLQMEEEIFSLFSWRDGSFKFDHSEPPSPGHAPVEIEIEPLLIEGFRRMDEWQRISSNIADENAVYCAARPASRAAGEIELRPNEWKVLSLINGFFPVRAIAARSQMGAFETYRILNTLAMAGLIALKPPPAAASKPPDPPGSPQGAAPRMAGDSSKSGPAFWNVGGLLARKKSDLSAGEAAALASAAPGEFVSPVGKAAACLNAIAERLIADKDFYLDESDAFALERHWPHVAGFCPKADLLCVAGNRVDAREFDGFAAAIGEGNAILGCRDDAMEALHRLWAHLAQLAIQRLGERAAQKAIDSVRESFDAAPTRLWREFSLRDFAAKAFDAAGKAR